MSTASTANQGVYGGAATGAAAGAAIGTAIAPGIGTAVGAGIGLFVGATIGSITGGMGAKKKAKKYAKLAQQVQREREQNALEDQYLQQIRQARMARSASLASAATYNLSSSSLTTAALSSIGSQSQYNIQYMAEDERLFELYTMYMQKAGKASDIYKNTMATGQTLSQLGLVTASLGMKMGSGGSGSIPAMSSPGAERAAMGGSSLGSSGSLFGAPGTYA